MSIRGRKRKLSYEAILAFAAINPTMLQADIASHFATSQSRISHILREGGVNGIHTGRPLTPKPNQTAEEQKWEKILHDAGLGMDRGLRLHGERILYGYDTLKENQHDGSATSVSSL
jgi:hypothetical protein